VASVTGPDSRLAPGTSFGRYVVESRLAAGGMGEVWLATARGPAGFQKRVVIKTVLPELVEKPGYTQMLVREASLTSQLDHPNIVHVFDLGCVDGVNYIAMEYLAGRSLAQMLRRAQEAHHHLPVPVVLAMAASSCDGLQYAHDYIDDSGQALGLLHRDISPSNIMLTFTGRVALLDFGVATAATEPYKTRSGALKGKFHYLAPERIRGETTDRRSDIYSLGVVLYQCLALRWPFHARNDFELLQKIVHQAPLPLRHYAPWIPSQLEDIVLHAMAGQPDDRYAEAGDLGQALRHYLRGLGGMTPPVELSGYLAGLFPEAPEIQGRSNRTPLPVIPMASVVKPLPEQSQESVDIVVIEAGSSVSTDVEAEPVLGAAPTPTPTPAPALARPAARSWPREDGSADIFPEPTRLVTPVGDGVDLFDGYRTRSTRPPSELGWPWAKTVTTRRPPERPSEGTGVDWLTKPGRTRYSGF